MRHLRHGPSIGIGLGLPLGAQRGDGSILALDLLNTTTAPLGTYTRATGGYTFTSGGVLAANTANQPRPDYDPATLAKRGWLMEGSRTNLLKRSEDFTHADWAELVTPTVSGNTAVAPDGTTTADTLTPDATNPSARQLTTVVVGTVYTASVYVKAAPTGSATHFRLTSNNASAWNTGASSKVALTSSWQRVEITWTQATTTSARVICGALTVAGALDSDCYGNVLIWGAQLEAGSFPSSYIPTTTGSASRSADLWTISNAQFLAATGQNIPQTGTMFVEFAFAGGDSTFLNDTRTLLQIDDGTASNYHRINNRSFAVGGRTMTIGNEQAALAVAGTNAVATVVKCAYSFANASVQFCKGGAALPTRDTITADGMPTTTAIGIGTNSYNSSNCAFAWLRRVIIYPFAMTDAQLQGITA